MKTIETRQGVFGQQIFRLVVKNERSTRNREQNRVRKLRDRLGAFLDQGQGAQQHVARFGVDNRALGLQVGGDQVGQALRIALPNPVRIDEAQLGEVETGRRAVDVGDVEPFDGLGVVEDFVVAVRPAKASQVVAHRFGQIAQLLIVADRLGAVTL